MMPLYYSFASAFGTKLGLDYSALRYVPTEQRGCLDPYVLLGVSFCLLRTSRCYLTNSFWITGPPPTLLFRVLRKIGLSALSSLFRFAGLAGALQAVRPRLVPVEPICG